MFSVLTSVYIKEDPIFLANALESIFNQTLLPNEVVLVQDGPITDELGVVITQYKEKYSSIIKILPLSENVGLGNALNKGLEVCSYEIVARMDTDDICYVNRFEEQIRFLENNPEISVIGSTVQEFDVIKGDLKQFRKLPLGHEELVRFSKYRNPLSHPSVMFKKQAVLNVGSYQDMPLFEDYYLWVRMILKGYKIANIDSPLLHFRIGNDMIGRRSGFSYFNKEIHFLKSIRKIGFLTSSEYFKALIVKTPLRVLPKPLLVLIYRKLLR